MALEKPCPHCGMPLIFYKNPVPTVDVVVHVPDRGVLLIERRNEPHGWALPGGFVEYGETVEHAAVREALEETGLAVRLTGLLGVYSDPARDPRQHTLSVVFTAEADDLSTLRAGDDAGRAVFFPLDALPRPVVFDHLRIVDDLRHRLDARTLGRESADATSRR